MKSYPIPPITDTNQYIVTEMETLVEKIIDTKQADSDAEISDLENEIDKLVYELYNLTQDEIAIVEGSV